VDKADYDRLEQGVRVVIPATDMAPGRAVDMEVQGLGLVRVTNDLTQKELAVIRAGGLLNAVRAARQ
jgi:aconitate hydratase